MPNKFFLILMPRQEFIFFFDKRQESILKLAIAMLFIFGECRHEITLLQYDQMVPSLTKYHPKKHERRKKKTTN
jgi:hypothetical protein